MINYLTSGIKRLTDNPVNYLKKKKNRDRMKILQVFKGD